MKMNIFFSVITDGSWVGATLFLTESVVQLVGTIAQSRPDWFSERRKDEILLDEMRPTPL